MNTYTFTMDHTTWQATVSNGKVVTLHNVCQARDYKVQDLAYELQDKVREVCEPHWLNNGKYEERQD